MLCVRAVGELGGGGVCHGKCGLITSPYVSDPSITTAAGDGYLQLVAELIAHPANAAHSLRIDQTEFSLLAAITAS